MPAGDRTGPNGMGPMPGRCMGLCNGFSGPGFGRGFGRGFRRVFGRGFGRGFGFTQPFMQIELTKEQEIADLKAERELIQRELETLNKKLSEIENK